MPNLFLAIVKDNWIPFKQKYLGYATEYYDSVIEKVLGCGDPEFGYIDFLCMGCGQDSKRVAFSCRSMFCLRCGRMFAAGFVEEVKTKLHVGVVYRHLILTLPQQLWSSFYESRHEKDLYNRYFRCGWECIQDILNCATRKDLRCGCLMVLHVVGRKGDYKPHLHILVMDGGIDTKTGEWVKLGYFPYEILHRKWQYHLLKMVKEFFKTAKIDELVDKLWKQYPKGFVGQILKGDVPKKMKKLTKYLAKYLFSPAIAIRRIKRYDPVKGTVTYEYQSHKTKRMELETVDVLIFLGRMVEQILPKGFQRVRYYGLQATASYEKSKDRIQEAMESNYSSSELEEDTFEAEGDVGAPKESGTYANQVLELTGKDPLRCCRCGLRMEVVKVWCKKYGTLVDRLSALRKAAQPVPRAPPVLPLTRVVIRASSNPSLEQQVLLALS